MRHRSRIFPTVGSGNTDTWDTIGSAWPVDSSGHEGGKGKDKDGKCGKMHCDRGLMSDDD
jgi:hypothetical protein